MIHLRNEHANVQYRLDGVELPEGISVFGQAIAARFAESMSLITGALPAQYGFQTAGVVEHPDEDRPQQSRPGAVDVWRKLELAATELSSTAAAAVRSIGS